MVSNSCEASRGRVFILLMETTLFVNVIVLTDENLVLSVIWRSGNFAIVISKQINVIFLSFFLFSSFVNVK